MVGGAFAPPTIRACGACRWARSGCAQGFGRGQLRRGSAPSLQGETKRARGRAGGVGREVVRVPGCVRDGGKGYAGIGAKQVGARGLLLFEGTSIAISRAIVGVSERGWRMPASVNSHP